MENGWCSAPTVLYVSIVKCFAVNRILTYSYYVKGLCVDPFFVCVFVLSRCLKSMLNSTVISNIDFACRTTAILRG